MFGILKSAPLAAFFVALMLPLTVLKDYWSQQSDSYLHLVLAGQVLAVIALIGVIITTRDSCVHLFNRASLRLVAPFLLWCLASAAWSISPLGTIGNIAVLALYLFALTGYWRSSPATQRTLALYGAVAIWVGIAVLALVLVAGSRSLGAIPPNLLGHYALVSMCLFFLHGRWKAVPAIAAFALILFSQARTVFVGYAVFGVSYGIITFLAPAVRSRGIVISTIGAVGATGAAIFYFGKDFVLQLISGALNVTTASRLGNDYTGRAEVWQVAYAKIQGRPYHGYGFRTRQTADLAYVTDAINAHSGVLNVILDVGIIGFALFGLWYAYAIFRTLDSRQDIFSKQRAVIASFLIGNVAILALEPNYISYVHPTSFMMLLALTFPMMQVGSPVRKPARKAPRRLRELAAQLSL